MIATNRFKDLELLIERYQEDLLNLPLPNIFSSLEACDQSHSNLFPSQLTINRIKLELPYILSQFTKYQKKREYSRVKEKLHLLERTLDEKSFVSKRIIEERIATHQKERRGSLYAHDISSDKGSMNLEQTADDNIALLRKRLISGGTRTLLDEANEDRLDKVERTNTFHESIQEDILSEITGIASNLKETAMRFSSKILEDTKVLNDTSDSLMRNETLMKSVGNNLNDYLINKTGGKITFWFLAKSLAISLMIFLMMVLLIKIFPEM